MTTEKKTPANIDEYIAAFPEATRELLQKMRTTVAEAAPAAEEKISYGMPTFALAGNLVHFAAFKNHIGFYPAPRGIEQFKNELSAYEGGKGSVRFPYDRPIPYDLVSRIVAFRVRENLERAEAKRKKE